jgi:hypothetical protein
MNVLPDGFLLKLIQKQLISKEICWAEHKYMKFNIHAPIDTSYCSWACKPLSILFQLTVYHHPPPSCLVQFCLTNNFWSYLQVFRKAQHGCLLQSCW